MKISTLTILFALMCITASGQKITKRIYACRSSVLTTVLVLYDDSTFISYARGCMSSSIAYGRYHSQDDRLAFAREPQRDSSDVIRFFALREPRLAQKLKGDYDHYQMFVLASGDRQFSAKTDKRNIYEGDATRYKKISKISLNTFLRCWFL